MMTSIGSHQQAKRTASTTTPVTIATKTTTTSKKSSKTIKPKTTSATSKTSRKKKLPKMEPPFLLSGGNDDNSNISNDSNHNTDDPSFAQALQNVAKLLQERKNIVVLVGAGMSVSCGIPDFRSPTTGLYATLDTQKLGLTCPEDLFDLEFFLENPIPFYAFAKHLYFPLGQKEQVQPSDSHKLLAMLEQQKRLLRVYTQNIDGLEVVAGVSSKKMVYAHGSLQWATCRTCQRKVTAQEFLPSVRKGQVPLCEVIRKKKKNEKTGRTTSTGSSSSSSSSSQVSTRVPSQRVRNRLPLPEPKRMTRQATDESAKQVVDPDACGGVLKPGVTFFGETLHDSVHKCLEMDYDKVDGLIVIGTSLSVAPISKVIDYLPRNIPRILINRTIVHPSSKFSSAGDEASDIHNNGEDNSEDFRDNYIFDAYLLGYCDDVTRALAKELFPTDSDTKKRKHDDAIAGTLLSSLLKENGPKDTPASDSSSVEDDTDENDGFEQEGWQTITVPPERVLLFPGAQASTLDVSQPEFQEVAHCDGCSGKIRGTIHKCTICFDYDLCGRCYPSLKRKHCDGQHKFQAEKPAA